MKRKTYPTNPLRVWRTRRGMSQNDLARRLAVSQKTVSRIENNQQLPNRACMRRILMATAGDVRPADFYDTPEGRGRAA